MAAHGLRHNWAARLQAFVRPRAVEHCELCGGEIPAGHPHLIDPAERRLVCACAACAAGLAETADTRFRRVPQHASALRDFRLTDAQWDELGIPIDMVFVFFSTPDGRPVAFYPGPAGPVESLLSLDGWSGLVESNPVLAELQPDVEALLVCRLNGAREYYRVPIDRCYELAGLIRTGWRGLSGGREVWEAIARYFARLRSATAAAAGSSHGWAGHA